MAADADAAATVSSTISLIPCPSKSGCSSARASSARSNENVTPPASAPASTVSRSERCQATRTSWGVPASGPTERIELERRVGGKGLLDLVTPDGHRRSIRTFPDVLGRCHEHRRGARPVWLHEASLPVVRRPGTSGAVIQDGEAVCDLPSFVTIVAWTWGRLKGTPNPRPAARPGTLLRCPVTAPHVRRCWA